MSWYRLAQQYQDDAQSILKTGTPGTASNPAGILVDEIDLRKLQSFKVAVGAIPITTMYYLIAIKQLVTLVQSIKQQILKT
jgi:hypothetical protein